MTELPATVQAVSDAFLWEVDRRLPGHLTGLFLHGSLCWGEFFPGSDIDFVAVWRRIPTGGDLELLEAAQMATRARHRDRTFDGFHCTARDLERDPREVGTRPVFYESAFDPAGSIDINAVTWCELAQRPIAVRGELARVYCEVDALIDHTRANLSTFWRSQLDQVEAAGSDWIATRDWATVFVTLGPARLHHVLRRRQLTSKSGAGRYVRDELDPRWSLIAREALRIREQPKSSCLYEDLRERGRDAHALMKWLVEDGMCS